MAGTLIPVAQASSNLVIPKNQYQGALAAAPAVRTNGTALQDGDLYFDTTTIEMLVYDATGTVWVGTAPSVSAAASAAAALVSENNAATSETNAATSETNAAASAATIPNPTALAYIRGNAGGTVYEVRTAAQVATDIGAATTQYVDDTAIAMAIALGGV